MTTGSFECLAADARGLIVGFEPPDRELAVARQQFLAFLEEHAGAAVDRDLRVGHMTASTVMLDDAHERVLLTLHPLIGSWVQLGGHFEIGDASSTDAARREVVEESGIVPARLERALVSLDRHQVRCRDGNRTPGPSVHYDLTFLAVAPPGARPRISEESLDLAWFPVDGLPAGADDVVRRLVERIREQGIS